MAFDVREPEEDELDVLLLDPLEHLAAHRRLARRPSVPLDRRHTTSLKAKSPGTRCAPEAASPSCSSQCIGRPAPRLESFAVGDEASEVFPAPGLSSLERRRGGAILQQEVERQYLANSTQPEADDAFEWAVETQTKMVDLKFCDLLGSWQHMTMPLRALDEGAFTDGLGFDGSSIRGWQGIAESDMLLVPDPASAVLDPFTAEPTISLVCEIADPVTREPYHRDPRRIARRAEEHLENTGIADAAHFGPECEFFVFDEVSYELDIQKSSYAVDSAEGHWNSGKPGLGYTVREKEGYFPPAPHDTLADLRTRMVLTLERLGIPCEFHHHEVASGGQ